MRTMAFALTALIQSQSFGAVPGSALHTEAYKCAKEIGTRSVNAFNGVIVVKDGNRILLHGRDGSIHAFQSDPHTMLTTTNPNLEGINKAVFKLDPLGTYLVYDKMSGEFEKVASAHLFEGPIDSRRTSGLNVVTSHLLSEQTASYDKLLNTLEAEFSPSTKQSEIEMSVGEAFSRDVLMRRWRSNLVGQRVEKEKSFIQVELSKIGITNSYGRRSYEVNFHADLAKFAANPGDQADLDDVLFNHGYLTEGKRKSLIKAIKDFELKLQLRKAIALRDLKHSTGIGADTINESFRAEETKLKSPVQILRQQRISSSYSLYSLVASGFAQRYVTKEVAARVADLYQCFGTKHHGIARKVQQTQQGLALKYNIDIDGSEKATAQKNARN